MFELFKFRVSSHAMVAVAQSVERPEYRYLVEGATQLTRSESGLRHKAV